MVPPYFSLSFGLFLCLGSEVSTSHSTVSVPPTVEISQQQSMIWNQIGITCQVKDFYPSRLQLTWLENGKISRTEYPSTITVNKDGTYSWTSLFLVKMSAHEEDTILTCQVEHDGQPPILKLHTLAISTQQKEQGIGSISSVSAPQLLCCL